MYLYALTTFKTLVKTTFSPKDFTFTLKNEAGNDQCYVTRVFRGFGEKLYIYDLCRQEVALVDIGFHPPRININHSSFILKRKKWYHPWDFHFVLKGTDLIIEPHGNEFMIHHHADTIGLVRMTGARYNFEIQIVEDTYKAFIIAIALALDYVSRSD